MSRLGLEVVEGDGADNWWVTDKTSMYNVCDSKLCVSDDYAANKYKVTVFTGSKRGSGTDANVCVTLFGDVGDSGERKLDTKRKNDFEAGS